MTRYVSEMDSHPVPWGVCVCVCTVGPAGDKRRAKLVMSLLDPLCAAEEKNVLKTPTK